MDVLDRTDVDRELESVAGALTREFEGSVPEAEVRRLVGEARQALGNPPVTQYVPILVTRVVRAQLRSLPAG